MKTLRVAALKVITIISLITLMIAFSPYRTKKGFDKKLVHVEVFVRTPVDSVYDYLANSDNAGEWSSFVDHITPLNPLEYRDGQVGSKRRCYKKADESGIVWDEEILIAERNKRRRLSIFNMRGFPLKADRLMTEQLYRPIDNHNCALAFTLFYGSGQNS